MWGRALPVLPDHVGLELDDLLTQPVVQRVETRLRRLDLIAGEHVRRPQHGGGIRTGMRMPYRYRHVRVCKLEPSLRTA